MTKFSFLPSFHSYNKNMECMKLAVVLLPSSSASSLVTLSVALPMASWSSL